MILDQKEFKEIAKHLEDFEKKREEQIAKSREVIKLSKQIIYSLHRNDLKEAEKYVLAIKKEMKLLSPKDYDTGMVSVAFQEYGEALCFFHFVKEKKIPTAKALNLDPESYLMGLCDLTGELMRRGVNAVIKKDYDEAILCKDTVDEIYGAFLAFDFRNGELRKKFDSIKWNLKKLEDVAYDIKTKLEK
ncbi:hypothetical protein J4410_02185 [Candidatus Woesearchaeota archaeon]|nr:hypothetical protein [Candidatus Woesearchaeota archaeon]